MDKKKDATDRPVSIHYIYKHQLTGYQDMGNGTCMVSITGEWNYVHTTIGSIKLTETPPEIPPAGLLYQTIFTARHPGHETTTPKQITDITGKQVMIKITYKSGKQKIIGNALNGPRLFIGAQSDNSTNLLIESNWNSTGPNLWNAPSVDSNPGGGL